VIGQHLACNDPHQCRFARAIAAEQANALTRIDRACHFIEQWRPAKTDADVVELNQWRHADRRVRA
jgi:hypothetical protein